MLGYSKRDDKLTGLLRRTYFDELVKRDWGSAQRESRRLSFLVFDLDCYFAYKETFGKNGSDQSFERVSRGRSVVASVAPATCAVASMKINRCCDDWAGSGAGVQAGGSRAGSSA